MTSTPAVIPPHNLPEVTGTKHRTIQELMLSPGVAANGDKLGYRNESTRQLPLQSVPQPLPLREIFAHRLDALRRAYHGTPEHGVMVCAVDPSRGVAGVQRLLAPEDGRPSHLILGRHERCHLRLMDPALSLRHAILMLRRLPNGDLRVRLMDLRTGLGLTGEDGRMLESVSVEGHLFMGLGRYVLMVLLGGEDLAFSEDGGTVFDSLPARVFFDTRAKVPSLSGPKSLLLDQGTGGHFSSGTGLRAKARGIMDPLSRVLIHHPPEPLQNNAPLKGDRRGTLSVECLSGTATVPVYEAQARDGVLLGRYERCESADLPLELPDTVSRVHALVLAEGEDLYVMDTASTFGVRTSPEEEVSGVRLTQQSQFMLGTETVCRWQPENG